MRTSKYKMDNEELLKDHGFRLDDYVKQGAQQLINKLERNGLDPESFTFSTDLKQNKEGNYIVEYIATPKEEE